MIGRFLDIKYQYNVAAEKSKNELDLATEINALPVAWLNGNTFKFAGGFFIEVVLEFG